jgi:predicted metal-dependent peptidase
MSQEQLDNEVKNLDAVDQEVLEMLLSSMPSHLGWEEGANSDDEAEAHQLSEHGRELLKSAIQSHNKSRGTIPGHIMELIRKMLLPPTVPWTEFLQTIIQRTRQTKKERGMARPSKVLSAMKKFAEIQARKVEEMEKEEEKEEKITPRMVQLQRRFSLLSRVPAFPGTKHSNKYTMAYAVDTSGSMGTNELQRGLAELQHVQKSDSDVNICVMYADTHVCKEYWIGPTDQIDPKMTGRGGTDFDPIFERVLELLSTPDKAPDVLIYCTDGWAPPPSIRLPIPVVWLITPQGRPVVGDAGHITIEMRDYQLGESN